MSTLGFILTFLAAVLAALPTPSFFNVLLFITGLLLIYHG